MKRIFLGLALVLVFAMTGCESTTNYPQVNIPEQIDTTSQNGSEHTPTLDLISNVFDVATLITLPYDKELLVTRITPFLVSFIPTQDTVEIRLENIGSDLGWLVSFDATSDPNISQVDANEVVIHHLEGVEGEMQFIQVISPHETTFNGVITVTQP